MSLTGASLRRFATILGIMLAVMFALIGVFSVLSLEAFEANFETLTAHSIPRLSLLQNIRAESALLLSSTNEVVLTLMVEEEDDEIELEREDVRESLTELEAFLASLDSLSTTGDSEDAELAADVISHANALIARARDILTLEDLENALALREELEEVENDLVTALETALTQEIAHQSGVMTTTAGSLELTEAVIGVAAILVPILVFVATRAIGSIETRMINRMNEQAHKMTGGDYASRIEMTGVYPLEYGELAENMNLLAKSVVQREGDLKTINETLERRVRERTREAEAARRIAEENNRLKSEFLATMSHELRTPLNAIEGFTSILRNKMGGAEYNEKTGRYVTRIEANSNRLLQLINDFLDISRIESGRLQLANSPFSPADAARKWGDMAAGLAEKQKLDFELKLDPELPKQLMGDEESISKIAINLLGNAVKFTDKGKVELEVCLSGDNWQIKVTDTGIGIPPHAREFIFDEFRQVDQSSKRQYGGTGLGLAIVQKLARAMGGQVTVESEVGAGSTFTVTLPLSQAAESAPAA